MTVRGYGLFGDWNANGAFTGTREDLTSYVLDDPVLSLTWGRDHTQSSSVPPSAKLDFALRNDDAAFSPENVSSPIYGKVMPGRAVQLTYDDGTSTTTWFSGVLDNFDVDVTEAARPFTADALDAWGRPGAEQLSTPLYSGLRTGEAIEIVLDAIGWSGGRDIDPGSTVMPWWWAEEDDAATAVEKIVDSEGPPAIAYVEGGTFVYRDRHHRLTRPASLTSQGLFTHIAPEGSGPADDFKILAGSFRYDHGLRRIVNTVAFEVQQRQPAPESEVWSTDEVITLAANESVPIFVKTTDPFLSAETPVDGLDYDTQSGSATVSLSRTSGQSLVMTVTAGGSATVLTRLALRAGSLPVVRTVKVGREDTASRGTHGRLTWGRSVPFANVYDAAAIADRIVATYADPRPLVTFSIANLDSDYMAQIVARRISDRITVRNDVVGVNRDFVVERIAHTIVKLGVIHQLDLTCEVVDPVQPANALTFDVAGKGFNDGAFSITGIDNPAGMLRFDVAGQGFNDGAFGT